MLLICTQYLWMCRGSITYRSNSLNPSYLCRYDHRLMTHGCSTWLASSIHPKRFPMGASESAGARWDMGLFKHLAIPSQFHSPSSTLNNHCSLLHISHKSYNLRSSCEAKPRRLVVEKLRKLGNKGVWVSWLMLRDKWMRQMRDQ